MKKMMISLAVATMMAASMSAQTENGNQSKQRPQKMEQRQQGPQKMEQRQQLTPEQMAEHRSQHAAHKMGLSDEQTKKFSSIYADYSKELRDISSKYPTPREQAMKEQQDGKRQGEQAGKGEPKAKAQMTDKELEQMHKNQFSRQRAVLEVQEKYYKKFRSVLTERQYSQLMRMDKAGKKFGKKGGKKLDRKGDKKRERKGDKGGDRQFFKREGQRFGQAGAE